MNNKYDTMLRAIELQIGIYDRLYNAKCMPFESYCDALKASHENLVKLLKMLDEKDEA